MLEVPVRPVSGCFSIAAAAAVTAEYNDYGCIQIFPSTSQFMTFSGIYILKALIHYKFVIRYLLSHYNYFPSLCLKPYVLLRDLPTPGCHGGTWAAEIHFFPRPTNPKNSSDHIIVYTN